MNEKNTRIFKYALILILGLSLVILLGLLLVAVFMRFFIRPTPEAKRNTGLDGLKIQVQIGQDERTPIIKTYEAAVYDSLTQEELEQMKDFTAGSLEGDLPVLSLLEDRKVYMTFLQEGRQVEPEALQVKITAYPPYQDPSPEGSFKEMFKEVLVEDGQYVWQGGRYYPQYEKYFMDDQEVEVRYRIGGKDLVSFFRLSVTNAEDGTDFFDSEELADPIAPEED